MIQEKDKNSEENLTHAERLADIADDMFERANKLDSISLGKKEDEAQQTIQETRDEIFNGVINVWCVIIDLLPVSDLGQVVKKELEIDGHKIISRCYHRLGNLEAAKQSIIRAIDLGYGDGFISLGAICMDADQTDDAEKAFQSAISKGVQEMRAHAGLGELYFRLGTEALKKKDDSSTAFFEKSEQEFLAAGKERFAEGYERAMELFETIGWKDKAMSFGEKAAHVYENNRLKYGDKLKHLSPRLRKIAGDERYERFLAGLGRGLGNIMGGGVRDKE